MVVNKALLFCLVAIVVILVFNAWSLGWKSMVPLAIIFIVSFLIVIVSLITKTTKEPKKTDF